jgi:hypothetical protein
MTIEIVLLIAATLASGLFAGAALYVTAVEHPARMSCGAELAIREFAPSYKRGAVMQASLAVAGSVAGIAAGTMRGDLPTILAAVLFGALVPFTLVVIFPTNKRLLNPALDSRSAEAAALLDRWGRLHGVRTWTSILAFLVLVARLSGVDGS